MVDRLTSIVSRVLFFFAVLLLIVGVSDRILRLFDLTLSWVPYEPGRLMELSAILVVFVISLLLRQIREEVKKRV